MVTRFLAEPGVRFSDGGACPLHPFAMASALKLANSWDSCKLLNITRNIMPNTYRRGADADATQLPSCVASAVDNLKTGQTPYNIAV